MLKALRLSFLLLLALAPLQPIITQDRRQVTARVKSSSGHPLQGVRVFCRSDRETETDQNGLFSLANARGVVFLQHLGYRPLALLADSVQNGVDIVMDEAKQTEWLIPSCAQHLVGHKIMVARLQLLVPLGARLELGGDVDYQDFSASHARGDSKRFLYGIWGPMASTGFPRDEWIISSTEFALRSWRFGDASGVEMRGQSKGGKFWRYFGTYGIAISYENASKEASDYFDRIIGSACVH